MAFAEAGRGDADDRRVLLQLGDGAAAAVAHAGEKPADQLMDHGRDGALVRNPDLDPLRDQLLFRPRSFEVEGVRQAMGRVDAHHQGAVSQAGELQSGGCGQTGFPHTAFAAEQQDPHI